MPIPAAHQAIAPPHFPLGVVNIIHSASLIANPVSPMPGFSLCYKVKMVLNFFSLPFCPASTWSLNLWHYLFITQERIERCVCVRAPVGQRSTLGSSSSITLHCIFETLCLNLGLTSSVKLVGQEALSTVPIHLTIPPTPFFYMHARALTMGSHASVESHLCSPWTSIFLNLIFRDRVSQCSTGCPRTHSVDPAGLTLKRPACLCLLSGTSNF